MEIHRNEIENILSSLKPAGLSDATLKRLEDSMSGAILDLQGFADIENQLSAYAVRPLRDDYLESLMALTASVPFPVNDKVVMFPGTHKDSSTPATNENSLMKRILAVAAVATLGGLAAFWTPMKARNEVVRNDPTIASPITRIPSPGIVTASYGTGIQKANDEGVIWTQSHQPNRVVRVIYQDRVLATDEKGVERMLLIPREELILIPEKVN